MRFKKYLSILLSVLMVLVCVGCDTKTTVNIGETSSESMTEISSKSNKLLTESTEQKVPSTTTNDAQIESQWLSEIDIYYHYDISPFDFSVLANFDYTDPNEIAKYSELYVYSDDKSLSDIAENNNIETIHVCQTSTNDLRGIEKFIGLKNFNFYMYDVNISDISDLQYSPNIVNLHLNYADKIEDFSPIRHLAQLEELSITAQEMNNISSITACTNLKKLSLNSFDPMDLSFIGELTELTDLTLFQRTMDISDISFLKNLSKLESLDITLSGDIDLSVIAELKNLKNVKFYNNELEEVYLNLKSN
jgi:internalin A